MQIDGDWKPGEYEALWEIKTKKTMFCRSAHTSWEHCRFTGSGSVDKAKLRLDMRKLTQGATKNVAYCLRTVCYRCYFHFLCMHPCKPHRLKKKQQELFNHVAAKLIFVIKRLFPYHRAYHRKWEQGFISNHKFPRVLYIVSFFMWLSYRNLIYSVFSWTETTRSLLNMVYCTYFFFNFEYHHTGELNLLVMIYSK